MECRVEDGHLRNAGQQTHAGANALEVRRVVERRELAHILDFLENVVGDERRLDELLAAVNDAVPDRGDLVDMLHDPPRGVGQEREHAVHRVVVAIHIGVEGDLPVPLRFLDDPAGAVGDADALGQALCDDLLGVSVDELVLERRTAAVEYEDLHSVLRPPVLLMSLTGSRFGAPSPSRVAPRTIASSRLGPP